MTSTAQKNAKLEALIESAANTIASVAPTLPTLEDVNQVMQFGSLAAERGYFLPNEDEVTRRMFGDYLTIRAALLSMLYELRPEALADLRRRDPRHPELFIVSYCAACLLVRSGRFVIDSFSGNRIIREKLNEAEPRFGIPRKQFTHIYRSLTSPSKIWIFLEATRYWKENRQRLIDQFQSDPVIQPILKILIAEEPWVESNRSYYTGRRLQYRLHSFLRRNHSGFKNVTFALFKASGSLIAELRMKWKRKRVTPGVQRKLAKLLQPGDVIITRHDDATSNLFLPGFWPHGALYIGTKSQRDELKIQANEEQTRRCDDPVCVLEARKDGVLFRVLSDTLNVDACTVIRPKLTPEQLTESLTRAISHEGKQYDFEFDFRRSDKLVCTEVIYRAYHGTGSIAFELKPRAGRVCLSAEDLLDAAVDNTFFDVIAVYGVKGNRFATGERAKMLLIESYRDS